MKKTILILGIIFLLVGIAINPSVAVLNSNDDITPPITTHTLDPPTPDGDNGWYVSDVIVTLNATDDMSGVKEIKYKVDGGATQTIIGDNGTFIVNSDKDNLPIEYWAIDNADNYESHHIFTIDMDQTDPFIDLTFEIIDKGNYAVFVFTANATDSTSKIDRVEYYINDVLQETVTGPGPEYNWGQTVDIDYFVKGFITNRNITDEYVKFYAFIVRADYYYDFNPSFLFPWVKAYDKAGNNKIDEIIMPPCTPQKPSDTAMYKWYTFSNNYSGYIGNYYIDACFEDKPIKVTPGNINFQFNKLSNRLSIGSLFLRFLDHFPLLQRLIDIWRNVLV